MTFEQTALAMARDGKDYGEIASAMFLKFSMTPKDAVNAAELAIKRHGESRAAPQATPPPSVEAIAAEPVGLAHTSDRVDMSRVEEKTVVPVAQSEPEFVDPLPDVPAFLKSIPNWIHWKLEIANGRATKVPYQVNGKKAASTRAEDWTDYRTAVSGVTIDCNGGVGFVVKGGIVGIDIDGCRDATTGALTEWAEQIIDALDSYTEITPSQTGVRVWVRGVLPDDDNVFNLDPACGIGDKVRIEAYASGRYFTVTGQSYFELAGDVEERDLSEVYKLFHEIRAKYPAKKQPTSNSVSGQPGRSVAQPVQIEKLGAFEASKYEIFMHGSIESATPFVISDGVGRLNYPSHSEADMAFATVLAIRYDGDRGKIAEDFRKSKLYSPERQGKWNRLEEKTIDKAIESAKKAKANPLVASPPAMSVLTASGASEVSENGAPQSALIEPDDVIPPFPVEVINGIYKRFVDVCLKDSVFNPQFVYQVAKMVVGAKMAGKVRFAELDAEPRYFLAFIGETGCGKSEAFQRVQQILKCDGQIGNVAGIKIRDSADSGAGLKDLFFEHPEDLPVILYFDEVASAGNKATATRNPAILDDAFEMFEKTSISRVKAATKNQKSSKTKNDARLSLLMNGQNRSVFVKALGDRTNLGAFDRLYPEYGVSFEVDDLLPPIAIEDAYKLLAEMNALNYSGAMAMAPDAKERLDSFWHAQRAEIRKKTRWKKYATLDAFMSAFGRRSKTVEIEDMEIAIKLFTRQLIIRQTIFTTAQIPDRGGYYEDRLHAIRDKQLQDLASGKDPRFVAMTERDFERATHASRDRESQSFNRVWPTFSRRWLEAYSYQTPRGKTVNKYLPATDE